MSAVCIVFDLEGGPVTRAEVSAMMTRLSHRGGDASGVWCGEGIGLGHTMRWTTPESIGEELPFRSRTGGNVITCDARLDNRDELLEALRLRDTLPKDVPDSQIVLAAYEKWGEGLAAHLIGDFVFAIWDAKSRKLVCGRDPVGVKHFYYWYLPGKKFVVASETKAIFALPEIKKEVDETHLGDILILDFHDKERTPYKNIKRLPANSILTVSRERFQIEKGWHPEERNWSRFRSPRRFEEEFREAFERSVLSRTRSAFPVGSMLSGGLDSSAISVVAARHLGKAKHGPLETFSAVFPRIAEIDPRIDERKYIEAVLREIECVPHFIEADAASPLEEMDRLQWHADHPVGAPNVFMDWLLFRSAEGRDVRVLLSGFDGDSTVSYGYEAFEMLARKGQWLHLVRSANALGKNMPSRRHEFRKLVWNRGMKRAAPESLRKVWRFLKRRPESPAPERSLPSALEFNYRGLNPQFAAEHELKERYFRILDRNQPEGADPVEAHWNALSDGLFAFALETFEKAGAAFGVEPRFPFFDRRLIELCINIPPSERILGGWTRSLFRRSMKGILPPEVRLRADKAMIGISFKMNLSNYGRNEVEQALFETPGVLHRYVDLEYLRDAYDRFIGDPVEHEGEPLFVNSSVHLSNWLRNNSAQNGVNG